MKSKKIITIIAAVGPNGELGVNGKLAYQIKSDLKHFKEITTGYTVIMGRKTFESLPKGALPNRTNIVVTRNPIFKADNVTVVNSIETAIECAPTEKVFIIGGGEIYKQSIDYADYMILTEVSKPNKNADVFFPDFNKTSIDWPYVTSRFMQDDTSGMIYKISTYMKHVVG